ncbi:hypothetical protein M407DRAFT_243357 [Tulasnella calospora MUT 4182]|uniref:BAR domain-containing protein n=1 Tax=Tulasnella calospora MUT 4182 TaxID=1051891 RepID=A0A0C3L140_9AGAM|nr:hypothetical protein M407DRAFT_243357 [Tulasnella calospora MUT 4182]
MDNWAKLTSSIGSLNLGSNAGKLAKGFSSSVQATRERLGQVAVEDITELPQEYKDLEARVDALKAAQDQMLRVISVYGTAYDYPTQIQESLTEFGTTITTGLAAFAATNLKGTKLPVPAAPTSAPAEEHRKTLPHAIARSSASAAKTVGPNDRLGKALGAYAAASEKIGEAHAAQDDTILVNFVDPVRGSLTGPLQLAMNARNAVKASRLQLDSVKQTLKTATGSRQEQARLEVENAEDDLVQKTENAIQQMKAVLENPEPLKTLNELAKAQLAYHMAAAEALQACQTELEELSIEAEGDYRKSQG